MDSFEQMIASILQRQGFWTQTSLKVDLTKEEKRRIGRHSSPRWELDVVAYRGLSNELLVVECKSYLDSPGVAVTAFNGKRPDEAARYKLFFEPTLREVVLNNLKAQMVKGGFCQTDPSVTLCLAAGRINGDEEWLRGHFAHNGWRLFGPGFIRDELIKLKETGYDNSVATVVTKMLLREPKRRVVVEADGQPKT